MRALVIAASCALVLASISTSAAQTSMTNTHTPAAQAGFAQDAAHDPYLWMEEIEGGRALAWAREQNARSLPRLTNDPRFAGLERDALAIANSKDRLPYGAVRDGFLYNFWQDETHVRGIWRRSPLADYVHGEPVWDTVLDFDALSAAEHANWVFKGADCLDGTTRCLIALSDGGRDSSTYREFDIATRAFVPNGFVVPDAKSNVSWRDQNTLLVGTDWGPGSMTESGYPFIVKAWSRGTPLTSAVEVIRGAAHDVSVGAGLLEDIDGSIIPIAVQGTTFFENKSYRLDGATPQQINLPPKSSIAGLFKGQLLFTLQEDWMDAKSGALCSYPLSETGSLHPHVTVIFAPGPRESIEGIDITHDAVLVAGYENVRGRLLRFAFDGHSWARTTIALPANGSVGLAGASPRETVAFANFEDFLTPSTLYVLEDHANTARAIRSLPAQFDASPYTVEQFEATSRDGTRVPYFVVHAKNMQLNGQNPTMLYAYGGFQSSMTPGYSPNVGKLWLEHGGVYVLANIRGGGEFGPAWHQAGLKTHRQVIYDDFYAVERDLVDRHITSPRRLGIEGGSNGGLLMGVMLNQHPEMIHAAVVQVPLLDMLRFDQIGAGASWVDEYGSPQVPEERAFLETISPYQNLRARPDFPEPFVETSTKDDRVHPAHARKYVARMLELRMPVLYYENMEGGHAAAANLNEAAHRRALEYTYLMQKLMD
ncbi:MAG: prolyl oligopeptidase family serine peptidase [Terricaulis sp.]